MRAIAFLSEQTYSEIGEAPHHKADSIGLH
jgi:hypothetical protein